MKKFFTVIVLLFTCISGWSQSKLWNDSTRDIAYEAPKSAFVGKWQGESKGFLYYFIINANGTFNITMPTPIPFKSDNSIDTIKVDFKCSGTWTKEKTKYRHKFNSTSFSLAPNKEDLNKLSNRRQDEFNTLFGRIKEQLLNTAKNFFKSEIYEILRIDKDYLILAPCTNDGLTYDTQLAVILYSENKIKTIEREAEEARLQEEQERLKAEAKAKEENRIYENPEEDAKFPGGDEECYKWLYDHIQYPEAARAQGIQGRVFLKFVVETDGSLTNIEVTRSPDPLLSQEALRVVRNMPKWEPAKNKGIVVRVEYNLPIMFKPD